MADDGIELEGDRPASLLNFAEQMVKEAEKQSEIIRQDAEAEAKQQAGKIVSDATTAAKAKANDMLSKAERENQDLLKRARKEAEEILKAADLRAEDRLAASVSVLLAELLRIARFTDRRVDWTGRDFGFWPVQLVLHVRYVLLEFPDALPHRSTHLR